MRKKKFIAAYILGAVLLFCCPLYSRAAEADENRNVRSVKETTYKDEDGSTKTILWTDNITPPTMNGADDKDSDFKRNEFISGGTKYVDYIAPYVAGNGWYDVNKTFGQDSTLCFAAAASNMLHWWMDQNADYIDKYLEIHPDISKAEDIRELQTAPATQYDSKIYNRFVGQFAGWQNGFWPDILQDQFINGYKPKEHGGTNSPEWDGPDLIQNGPYEKGGFFYSVFGPDILTLRRYYDYGGSYQNFSNDLKKFVRQGDIATLTYNSMGTAHIVTVWGIELDSEGNLTAVYFSDSDDEKEAGMRRYRVVNRNGATYVTTNTSDTEGGSMVTALTTLATGKDTWETVTAQTKTELKLTWEEKEFIYNGEPQIPKPAAWNIVPGDDVSVMAEGEGITAGTHTASAKIVGKDVEKYSLPAENTKQFAIGKSGTVFDGGVKTYRGAEETAVFDVGDTMTVKVSPRATGKHPSESAKPLSSVVPTDGQMKLYKGSWIISDPVSIDSDGSYTLKCSISSDNFQAGENTLRVKFQGDNNMADCEQTFTVTVTDAINNEREYVPVAEVSPTCELSGKKAHFIDEDGKLYIEENGKKREVTEQELVLPAKGHHPAERWTQKEDRHYHECSNGCGVRLDESACSGGTATTTKRAICKICGNAYGELLEKPAHTVHVWADKYTTEKKATCTAEGKQSICCLTCGAVKPGSERKLARLSHTYRTTVVKATTKKNGKIANTCTGCRRTVNQAIARPKSISLSTTSYTYNGKTKKPSVRVKTSAGKTLSSKNYRVSYSSGRKNVGQYKVKITFRGNYSGSVTKTFRIIPKKTALSSVKAGKKKMTVKWKRQSKQASGYQIQYSVDKRFKKGVKTSTIKKYKTTSKSISKLKSKKKYYVRIRTYKTVKINGKSAKLYSGWSKAKAVRIK